MLHTLYCKLAATGLAAFLGFQACLAPVPVAPPNLGATIPTTVALFETALASKITSTQTTMTLVASSTKDGTNLVAGTTYGFIIDEGTPSEEFVVGVASTTAAVISGLTRGISVIDGKTTVAALEKTHRFGASVKITNFPQLAILSRISAGLETFPSVLSYAFGTTTGFTASSSIPNKQYVDSVATSGAPDALVGTKGIVDLSNITQFAAGTGTGATSAKLVPPNSYFNATQSATTTGVVTGTNGKIASGFIDATANYVWSGTHSFSTTTSVSGAFSVTGSSTLASTTFTGIPFIATSTPTLAQQVVSKNYLGTLAPLYLNSNAFASEISTSTFSLSNAGRVAVMFQGRGKNSTSLLGCDYSLFVDGTMPSGYVTTTISSAGNNSYENISMTFITASLTAASHTITASSSINGGGTCSTNANLVTEFIGQ